MKKSRIYSKYHFYRRWLGINKNVLYFESHAGNDFAGNMYRIAESFLKHSPDKYKIYICKRKENEEALNVRLLRDEFPKACIETVERSSKENYRILATAKYLFTDVALPVPYEKRKGQIVVQTWHGTPLKKIGFDYTDDVALTSSQKRAFAISDYILFPNEYTMEHMIRSYRMEHSLKGKILLDGYPRNIVFFDDGAAAKIRKDLKIESQTVFAYLPTWRGAATRGKETLANGKIQIFLNELDQKMSDRQVLFAKLHRLDEAEVDFTGFRHIRPFPKEYETYQMLAAANCLITDYSSVMFDYLCTRRKIILFAYDKNEYLSEQGMYFDFETLPFPIVENIDALVEEMKRPKDYDDSEAAKMFCPYDDADAADRLYRRLAEGEENCRQIELPADDKENVLLYAGALTNSLPTHNFVYMLDHLDTSKANYCVTYRNSSFRKSPLRLQVVDKKFDLIAIDSFEGAELYPTASQERALNCYKKHPKMRKLLKNKVRKFYEHEFNRQFFGREWDRIIRFCGSDEISLELFAFAPVKEKYILTYKSYKNADKSFRMWLKEAWKNGCTQIGVKKTGIFQMYFKNDVSVKELQCFKDC